MTWKVGLDPGHGGRDPGAVGSRGLKEKEVTLEVALMLGERLKVLGCEVVFSRDKDRDVSLEERAAIFNRAAVDLVVSLHVNSSTEPLASYVSTYILDQGGRAEVAAGLIQKELVASLGWPDGGVRKANFYILRETWAPAVLVEMGFLSNAEEEEQLSREDTRRKIASALARGIALFLGVDPKPLPAPPDIVGHWAEASIRRCLELGLMHGYPDGTFRPDQPATRAELAVALISLIDRK